MEVICKTRVGISGKQGGHLFTGVARQWEKRKTGSTDDCSETHFKGKRERRGVIATGRAFKGSFCFSEVWDK